MPRRWFADLGYDRVFEKDMTICVESYIGEKGGHEGIKLGERVRIIESGCEPVSKIPFKEELLT